MRPVPIHTILTHESPDLDAMLSVLLLRKFGEPFFPGVAQAGVAFHSAGELPDGKTAAQLEKEGILAVDIGGGRFDTHPAGLHVDQKKQDRSAADLVAECLGVLDQPEWRGIIEYTRLHDSSAHNLYSRDALHGLFGLINILNGIQIMYPSDSATLLEKGIRLISCIPSYAAVADPKNNFSAVLVPLVEDYLGGFQYETGAAPAYLDKLLKWTERLKAGAPDVFPEHELDDIVTLKAIAVGAERLHASDPAYAPGAITAMCLQAIVEREKRWFDAVECVVREAVVRQLGPARIVTVDSPNGLTIKAARYKHRAALVIYRNSVDQAISFSLNNQGPLNSHFLAGLTARIRIAEGVYEETPIDYEQVDQMGKVLGWFLHQSGNILLRGSLKSRDFSPTRLPLPLITDIAYAEVISFLKLSMPAPKLPMELERAFVAYNLAKMFQR